ncbi:MAG: hypothetical protein ACO2Y3_05010 [Methylophilaceae bacterium]
MSLDIKREFLSQAPESISLLRVCELLGINRSSLYYQPVEQPSLDEVIIMNRIHDIWLDKDRAQNNFPYISAVKPCFPSLPRQSEMEQ